jgi:glycosyltransferase involved in cell wall biosynthesis
LKVGIVWHCVYPWDVRIEKFTRTIRSAGHSVTFLTKGTPELPPRELCDGMRLRRVGSGRLSRLSTLPFFFNPVWISGIGRWVRSERPDLLLVRDLPLAATAALAGKKHGIPVVLDMAENYPAALLTYRRKLYLPFLFGNGLLPRAYERWALGLMEEVIVVAEEQKSRLVTLGYPAEQIHVVQNTPEHEELERLSAAGTEATAFPYILYSGFMDRHRGIPTLIRAFSEIKDRYPELKLLLIGNGNDYRACVALADELRVADRVIFKGWLDPAAIPGYIKNCTVCVIPHLKSEHTDTTIPNKIFDYLYFERPLVVSDAAPLRRILQESGGGLVFRSGDSRGLSDALSRILEHRDGAAPAQKGKQLIETKYNWRNDAKTLAGLIARYAGQ